MPFTQRPLPDFRRTDIPVEVCTMAGRKVFENLAAAQEEFPDLDLFKNGQNFTWAMYGFDKEHGVMARFETWEVERILSR